jgi:hypothetical protein
MRIKLLAILVANSVLITASVNAQGNLLINGSFELPVVSYQDNFTGSFSFPGWTGFSTGSGGDGTAGIVAGTQFGLTPDDGNQDFSFNGNNPLAGTYIEQTFATMLGSEYSVAFAVGRNNGFSDQILALESQVFGSSGQLAIQISAPPSSIGWSLETFTFVADSDASTLQFTDISGSNPNTDLELDAVSVTALVPEPSTVLLLLCGITCSVVFGKKLESRGPPSLSNSCHRAAVCIGRGGSEHLPIVGRCAGESAIRVHLFALLVLLSRLEKCQCQLSLFKLRFCVTALCRVVSAVVTAAD